MHWSQGLGPFSWPTPKSWNKPCYFCQKTPSDRNGQLESSSQLVPKHELCQEVTGTQAGRSQIPWNRSVTYPDDCGERSIFEGRQNVIVDTKGLRSQLIILYSSSERDQFVSCIVSLSRFRMVLQFSRVMDGESYSPLGITYRRKIYDGYTTWLQQPESFCREELFAEKIGFLGVLSIYCVLWIEQVISLYELTFLITGISRQNRFYVLSMQ